MKNIVLVLGLLLSSTVFAESIGLRCQSANAEFYGDIYLDEAGMITNIKISEQDVWPSNITVFQKMTKNAEPLIEQNKFLQGLKFMSKVVNYKTVTLNISAGSSDLPLEKQLEILSEDGAGIAYLQFFDENHNIVGNSAFVGWAGFLYNCK